MTAEQIAKLKELADRWANDPPEADNEYDIAKDVMDLLPEVLGHIKELTEAISAPESVWANMLRGTIARPRALDHYEECKAELEKVTAERDAARADLKAIGECVGGDPLAVRGLVESMDAVIKERDAALKACSEMRDAMECDDDDVETWNHALSSDCGKGYHADGEWKVMVDALRYTAYQRLPLGNTVFDTLPEHWQQKVIEALAHAERLTGKDRK